MYRVIIADDEPKIALLIKNLIQWDDLGLTLVAIAGDGVAALALITEHKPDIVITDIRMPGYDGIELIDRAKQVCAHVDFVIVSGYRQFDYAQKAIRFGVEDYLLKPLKAAEINQTLKKLIAKYHARSLAVQHEQSHQTRMVLELDKVHDQFMVHLLQLAGAQGRRPAPPLQLAQINQDYQLTFQNGNFQAFVLKADVHFDKTNMNVTRLLKQKIQTVIARALRTKCHLVLVHPTRKGMFGLVNSDETQSKSLRKALGTVIDELQSQHELFDRIKVTIGLGRPATDINDMCLSIREAEYAVANRLLLGVGKIIDRVDGEDAGSVCNAIITAGVRTRLLQAIEALDPLETSVTLDHVANQVKTHPQTSGASIGCVFEECMSIMRFGLKNHNMIDDTVDALQRDVTDSFDMCSNASDVFGLLKTYATDICTYVRALRKSEHRRPVREAQKYIQTNFAQPISLNDVSQRAGFNPTYFSLLFKKEVGMNFIDYLTDVRVREAKRLLSNPQKTIADIAEEVGYIDIKHFSKVFTRLSGLHPSKYRKIYY